MKISFSLSSKSDAEGKCEILLRANRKTPEGKVITLRAKSEVYTLPVFFDSDMGINIRKKRIIAPEVRKAHMEQKAKLDDILKKIDEEEAKLEKSKHLIVGDWLATVVNKHLHPSFIAPNEKSFYELMIEYIDKKGFSEIQKRHLHVIMRDVKRYETYVRLTDKKNPDYKFNPSTVTKDEIEDWQSYMKNEKSLLEEEGNEHIAEKVLSAQVEGISSGRFVIQDRGENTMIKLSNRLKSFFRWLNTTKGIDNNPFEGLKIESEKYGNVVYPTMEERNAIYSTPMKSKEMEIIRDSFILQCMLGCRISDLMNLTEKNIVDNVLRYTPHKTKDETGSSAEVPLNDIALEIIAKYRGADRRGRLMPFPSSQQINREIKDIFKLAGVTRNVEVRDPLTGEPTVKSIADIASTHMARRCFVGLAYQEVKDPNIVARMSGHVEGSKSFARYRKIDTDILREVTDKIGRRCTSKQQTADLNVLSEQLASLSKDQLAVLLASINK